MKNIKFLSPWWRFHVSYYVSCFCCRVRFKRSGSIELLATDGVFLEDPLAEGGAGLNPWVLTCHKQHMNHCLREEGKDILKEETVEEEREFIVLENLVSMYSYPCILDLKMGTRQYGDTASLAKKQSKMVKVVSTTSAKLGLRVGGMQVNCSFYLWGTWV